MRWMYRGLVVLFFMLNTYAYAAEYAELKKALQRVIPGQEAQSIEPSSIDGIYEIVIGGEVLYGTKDGKYIIQGSVYNVQKGVNETEIRRSGIRAKVLAKLNENELIVFAAKNAKHTVTVFTDIDCGYCRKLHSQIDQYNAKGISVRYAAFPRAGIGSASYKKAVSVWCADDRKKAMTKAKAGAVVTSKTCDSPVAKHYRTGTKLGINGTPAIFLQDGTLLPGYIPPARLSSMLEVQHAKR